MYVHVGIVIAIVLQELLSMCYCLCNRMFGVLSAILHIGNVEFQKVSSLSSQIHNNSVISV